MRIIAVIILLFVNASCSNVERLDTAEIKDKMDNYKIKKVTPSQIMSQLSFLGEKLKSEVAKINTNDCDEIKSKVDSLSKEYEAEISLVDITSIGINEITDSKEKMLYEAYIYDFSKGQKAASNAQKIGDDYVYSFGLNENASMLECQESEEHFRFFWKVTWSQGALVRSF